MLDIKFIRENPELVKKAARDKGERVDVDHILKIDSERRELLSEVESLKHKRNVSSDEIGALR